MDRQILKYDLTEPCDVASSLVGVDPDILYGNMRSHHSLLGCKIVALWLVNSIIEQRGLTRRAVCQYNPRMGGHAALSARLKQIRHHNDVREGGAAHQLLQAFREWMEKDTYPERISDAMLADVLAEIDLRRDR